MPIDDPAFRKLVPRIMVLHQILPISRDPAFSWRCTHLERINLILLYPLPALSP